MVDNIQQGRYAYEGLERVMHEKARLSILTSLLTQSDGLLFSELKELCALTDGNLSRHIKVLEDEGLVEVHKRFYKKRPQTSCLLTNEGRTRFLGYLQALGQVIEDAIEQSSSKNDKLKLVKTM